MSKLDGYRDVVVLFMLMCLWVFLVVFAFFYPHLSKGAWVLPSRVCACLFWFGYMLWIATKERPGGNAWSRVYRGEISTLKFSGAKGVLVSVLGFVVFSCMIGWFGVDVAAFPGFLFASSESSSDFRVNDISYFRNSRGSYYYVDVTGEMYQGKFPWSKYDRSLLMVHIVNNINSHDVNCLNIKYRYWYFGAIVQSLDKCKSK